MVPSRGAWCGLLLLLGCGYPSQASLRRSIRNIVSECPRSAYSDLQFLSFEIHTHLAQKSSVGYAYTGLESDTEDFEERLRVMQDAIEKAVTEASSSRNVLKVFQAPEFFFRGPNGAYDIDFVLNSIGPALAETVSEDRFKDFLFVFGTAVGKRGSGGSKKFYNLAFIVRGGASGDWWMLPKSSMGRTDFAEHVSGPYANPTDLLDQQVNQRVITGEFVTDNIYFSADICYDHTHKRSLYYTRGYCDGNIAACEYGVACDSNTCSVYEKRPQCLPQFQLITSAGMDIREDAISVVKGGVVMHTDGMKGSASNYIWERALSIAPFKTEVLQLTEENPNFSRDLSEQGPISPVKGIYDFRVLSQINSQCPAFCEQKDGPCVTNGHRDADKQRLKNFFKMALMNTFYETQDSMEFCQGEIKPAIHATARHPRRSVPVYPVDEGVWCDRIGKVFYTRDCMASFSPQIRVFDPVSIPPTRLL